MINSVRGRVLLGVALAVAAMAAFLWALQRRPGYDASSVSVIRNPTGTGTVVPDQPSQLSPTVAPPSETASLSPAQSGPSLSPTLLAERSQSPTPSSQSPGYVGRLKLIVPVAGVKPEQLQDTFKDARSEGREHDALDIPAAAGTPVLAAADGEILKLFPSERGGTTIYQLMPDKNLILYYAHLQRYADGLTEGKPVRQGEVIGYVGDTGNAGTGNYHLHFSISIVADPKRYWEGTNINPYPFLHK
jgi:peptidoglycan LD-endopeptidase LytH